MNFRDIICFEIFIILITRFSVFYNAEVNRKAIL
jgi:hypothetical protein